MKKALSTVMAAVFILTVLCQSALAVSYAEGVTAEMNTAQYWVDRSDSPDAVIATLDEIRDINTRTVANSAKDYVVDLTASAQTYDGTEVMSSLKGFEVTADYYIDGKKVTEDYYSSVRANIDNPLYLGSQNVRYGLVCRNTALKWFPCEEYLSDAADDLEFDQTQLCTVFVGEPLIIKTTTVDGRWYYADGTNCSGWVWAADVALCADRAGWLDYISACRGDEVLVVTANGFKLEQNAYTAGLSGLELKMGTVLPLMPEEDVPAAVDHRTPYGNYVVSVPVRTSTGGCEIKDALVPLSRDVSVGYLPYTINNYTKQMFKLLGNRYGWGGMMDALDCSQYIDVVSRCFGFVIARNTTWQAAMPVEVVDLSGYEDAEKERVIEAMPCGTILQFSGHTMFYLGSENGKQYVISSLGNFVPEGGSGVERVRTVTVNSLDVTRASGKTWLTSLTAAILLKRPSFADTEGIPESDAIESLALRGIVRGDGERFYPEKTLTRRELAVMVARIMMLTQDEAAAKAAFSDLSGYGAGYIGAVCKAGLLMGVGESRFDGDGLLTGAQADIVMERLWTALKREGEAPRCGLGEAFITRAQTAALLSRLY